MRLGSDVAGALAAAGGRAVYDAAVRIDGSPGRLAVYGFDQPAQEVAARLRQALGAPEMAVAASGFVPLRRGSRIVSLIWMPAGSSRKSLVMAVERPAESTARPESPAGAEPALEAQAVPLFTASNEKSKTALTVAETASTPGQALATATRQLAAEGWSALTPAGDGPAAFAVYGRGRELCLVQALPAGDGSGRTRITVLRRRETSR
jgi:hypothetical protein